MLVIDWASDVGSEIVTYSVDGSDGCVGIVVGYILSPVISWHTTDVEDLGKACSTNDARGRLAEKLATIELPKSLKDPANRQHLVKCLSFHLSSSNALLQYGGIIDVELRHGSWRSWSYWVCELELA